MYNLEIPWYRSPRYSPELEQSLCRQSRENIRQIQTKKFKQAVEHAWNHVPFYRWFWGEAGVHPGHISTIDDIVKLPVWNKQIQKMFIEKHPPFGNFYTFDRLEDANFIVSTSGTTGDPVIMPLKEEDIPGLQDTTARTFGFIGIHSKDIVQVLFTYSTMGAAWACTWAAQGVGATVLPASSGKTTPSLRQVSWIRQAGVTVLIGTPSYIRHLADVAMQEGIDPAATAVRIVVTAGEIASEEMRKEIEKLWNAECYDLYGTVDTMSWLAVDCNHGRKNYGASGKHIWEDTVLIEALDENGKRCPNGEYGNMTITSWSWKNSPRIRYSIGDAVAVDETPCACGRTLARMLPIRGRMDDVIRFHGQNIYPLAVDNFLKSFNKGFDEYMVELVNDGGSDKLFVTIEYPFATTELEHTLRERFVATFNVTPTIRFVSPGTTAKFTGSGREPKVKRFFDRTKKKG